MDDLRQRLADWTAAGIIGDDQARAIARFETSDGRIEPDPGGSDGAFVGAHPRRASTSPAEAIGYVGAALALGATALILGDLWDRLLIGGRLALVAVLTLVVFGAALTVRSSPAAAMRRLCGVLLAATVAGTGWFTGIVASELIGFGPAASGTTAGVVMIAVAGALYAWTRRPLVQIALLAAVLFAALSALGTAPIGPATHWYGLVIGGTGLVWFLLGWGRWLEPQSVTEIAGSVVLLVGVQVAAVGRAALPALLVGVVVAGGLVALAVGRDRLHHLVLGALGLFVLVPQLVFEVFGDAIGAPATLLLVGLLLVVLAVGLGRARREVARESGHVQGDRT